MRRSLALLATAGLFVSACSGSDEPSVSPTDISADTETGTDTDTDTGTGTGTGTGTDTGDTDAGEVADVEQSTGSLVWGECEDANEVVPVECATLEVPLDYADPDGEQIDIAVARVATAPGSARVGSVVFNPGGPGGSGVEFVTTAALIMPAEVQGRFDLVGFDPRGVGASTAIDCAFEIDDEVPLLEAGDDAGWQALVDEAESAGSDCTAASNELAPHVGTNNAARDLDMLREALGDEGLTYVGYSYGTRLGATYAELFPDNVRALVLDAAVQPTSDLHELSLGQADGFDRALENFAAACDADSDCLLADVGPTLEVIDSLRVEIAEVGSFPTDDPDRVLTAGEFELGVVAALYSKETWPFLAQGLFLAEAEQDGTLLQVIGDQLAGRRSDGTYDNSQVANGFINCADDPTRPSVDEARADADEAADRSMQFSPLVRADTGCLGFPAALDPLIIGPAVGAPPIVVIGNSGDPATPYEWSVELAESLDSAVLFTVEAEGHTAFGSIECVTEPISAYLVDLEVPAADSSCSDNADADFFVPASETEIGIVLALVDCLRDNGLDIPEVTTADILADPSGEFLVEFLDPTNPAVVAAIGECADIVAQLQSV